MSIEVSLEWSCPLARHRDRLVLREAALQANGRWAAAGAELAQQAEVALDALPWCQPGGLPVGAGFRGLQTESLRGLARPADDKYIDQRLNADPLFAVWGMA